MTTEIYRDLGEITHSGRRKNALKVASETKDPRKFGYSTKTYFPKAPASIHYYFFTKKKLTKKEAILRILQNDNFNKYCENNMIEVLKKYMTT